MIVVISTIAIKESIPTIKYRLISTYSLLNCPSIALTQHGPVRHCYLCNIDKVYQLPLNSKIRLWYPAGSFMVYIDLLICDWVCVLCVWEGERERERERARERDKETDRGHLCFVFQIISMKFLIFKFLDKQLKIAVLATLFCWTKKTTPSLLKQEREGVKEVKNYLKGFPSKISYNLDKLRIFFKIILLRTLQIKQIKAVIISNKKQNIQHKKLWVSNKL